MQPEAFHLGPFSVNWYGVMVALGFMAGLWTASRRAPRDGLSAELVLDLGPWLIVGAILGARVLYVIMFWNEQFAGRPADMFKVWQGGLVYYGGLIGSCLACIIYARIKKLPLWKTGDVMAPSVALGQFFGRVGCLLNGCCYGRVTTCPWGIRYPSGHETHPEGGTAATVHPTQVYESALTLALYLGLAWWFRRKKYDGQVFAFYLVGYAIIRSTVEMFRGDYPERQILAGWATPAHLVSAIILTIGIVLLLVLKKSRPRRTEPIL